MFDLFRLLENKTLKMFISEKDAKGYINLVELKFAKLRSKF